MTQGELDENITRKWRCHCSATDIQHLIGEYDGFRADRARVLAGIRRHVDAKTENKRYGRQPSLVTKLRATCRRLVYSLGWGRNGA